MASTIENLHLAIPHQTNDPQQQLVEVLGLGLVLKERRRFLLGYQRKGTIEDERLQELLKIEHSLTLSQSAVQAVPLDCLHTTQAGRRLMFQIRNAKKLLVADQATLQAMIEFPESEAILHLSRRLAYLRALELLDLLPARGVRELKLLRCLIT